MDWLRSIGVDPHEVMLIRGGSQPTAVLTLAADIFGVHVVRPESGEYVARGAARQAAWALSGEPGPPDWPLPAAFAHEPGDVAAGAEVWAEYGRHRRTVFGV